MSNPTLKVMAIKHPYYCSESNYYNNDAVMNWESMTDFLDEFEDADIDMNLCFRWDIEPILDKDDSETGHYSAEVFIMGQRKGKFIPNVIKRVNEAEAARFKTYALRHWEVLSKIWEPLSQEGN